MHAEAARPAVAMGRARLVKVAVTASYAVLCVIALADLIGLASVTLHFGGVWGGVAVTAGALGMLTWWGV